MPLTNGQKTVPDAVGGNCDPRCKSTSTFTVRPKPTVDAEVLMENEGDCGLTNTLAPGEIVEMIASTSARITVILAMLGGSTLRAVIKLLC